MRKSRPVTRLLALTLVVGGACGGVAGCTAFDPRSVAGRAPEFTPAHIERAKQILESNDPRRLKAGAVQTVAITAADADLALNYVVHRYAEGGAEAHFGSHRVDISASGRVSALPWRPYVTVDVRLVEGTSLPAIEQCRIGQLPLPGWLAEIVLNRVAARVWSGDDLARLRRSVKKVEFADTGPRLTYQWDPDLMDTVKAALVPPDARERLRVYQQALADAARIFPPRRVSLAEVLTPVFAVAARRGATADPVVENRAAILVLTFYVDGRSLAEIVPDARRWTPAAPRVVTLNGRDDLTKHFMISAALSANTGGPFADAVGIYKEVTDSRGGSGFSFNDLAADRAGSRLGGLAEGRESARRLQARLGVPLTERILMPETSDLPEFMPEPEFKRRFGGIGAFAYAQMMAEIEARIARLPLYQQEGL
jgi:hypothetical protein